MINIRWVGPNRDYSGYAKNSRMFVQALSDYKDINLAVQTVTFESKHLPLEPKFEGTLSSLESKRLRHYDYNIINLTPENFPRLKLPGVKNVGYTTFETDKICDRWVDLINENLHGVFTTSDFCTEVFKASGVQVPTYTVRPGATVPTQFDPIPNLTIKEKYKFLSVFQWSERKNPIGLLSAFCSEFSPEEDVCLIIKTYGMEGFNTLTERSSWERRVQSLLASFNRPHPPVYFIFDELTEGQMNTLYRMSDCFVLFQRGEGHGLPHFQSAILNKPVITTGWSAPKEYLSFPHDDFCVGYSLKPVVGQMMACYDASMNWAEADLAQGKRAMRRAFTEKISSTYHHKLMTECNWNHVIADQLIPALKSM